MHISDWSSDVCSSDLTVDSYKYYVVPDSAYGTPFARYAAIAPHISSGVCKPTGVRKQACAAHRDYGWPWPDNKYCDDYYATEYECTADRSEEHTSELQSLMRISYAVFCLKKKKSIINEQK